MHAPVAIAWRLPRLRALFAAVLAVALLLTGAPAPDAEAAAPEDGRGLRLLSVERIDARHRALKVYSPAMDRVMGIRVLLPRNYASTSRRYPALYLHHGGGGDERRWTSMTRVEQITAKTDVLVVMPSAVRRTADGDVLGWFSDWYANGRGNQWESYHIDELIPFIDAQYRTIASRRGRAVAGLSMGGYGALAYASRHPDLFAATASFAGPPDTVVGDTGGGAALAGDDVWGPYSTQEVRHRGHNPRDLIRNLQGVDVYFTCGTGVDPEDLERQSRDDAHWTVVEPALLALNDSFSQALTDADIEHVYKRRMGNHTWRYWEQDFRGWLPHVMRVFDRAKHVTDRPVYRTADDSFTVWDWHFDTSSRPLEFLWLDDLNRRGFYAIGSGVLTVTSAPIYRPGETLHVKTPGRAKRAVRADDRGRLRFSADFGVRHTAQQFTPEADLQSANQRVSDYFASMRVTITKR